MGVVNAIRLFLGSFGRWESPDDSALREKELLAEAEALEGLLILRKARPQTEQDNVKHLKKEISQADALLREAIGR